MGSFVDNKMQWLGFMVLACIAITLMQIPSSTACMCMPTHSQTSYCNSDYGKSTRRKVWKHSTRVVSNSESFVKSILSPTVLGIYDDRMHFVPLTPQNSIHVQFGTFSCCFNHSHSNYVLVKTRKFLPFILTVILARILRKSVQKVRHNNVYKIEIRKAYKV